MTADEDLDLRLRRAILDLLDRRRPGATICPSDVARDVGRAGSWRTLMEPTRSAAAALVEEGLVVVTQGGRPVDVASARGPVRIRRVD